VDQGFIAERVPTLDRLKTDPRGSVFITQVKLATHQPFDPQSWKTRGHQEGIVPLKGV
jgi:hypothetical protein